LFGETRARFSPTLPRPEVGRSREFAELDLLGRFRDEAVDQVVGLHAEAFPTRHLDEGACAVLLGELDAERLGRGRRERDHLVREVRGASGELGESRAPHGFLDDLLRIRLPHVDHVDDARGVAETPAGGGVRARFVVPCPVKRRLAVGREELGRAVGGAVRDGLVLEVDAERAELPELVRHVLPRVRDRAVRADEDFVRVFHPLELRRAFERHHPAAGVLPLRLEARRGRLLQELERLRPEVPPEDVALAREKIVRDADPRHRRQVNADDGLGEPRRTRRDPPLRRAEVAPKRRALDRVEDAAPLLLELLPLRVGPPDERVEVPRQVSEPARRDAGRIERKRGEDLLDLAPERACAFRLVELLRVQQPDDDVRHLYACVVEVVLRLDGPPESAEVAHEDVAEDGVSQVPDVRSLVRVDVRVLDDHLPAVRLDVRRRREQRRERPRAVEPQVDVAAAFDGA
jgi:hypothetical protein